MRVNRRNVLAGLGGLTVAGGALFGTGAFSSVDADRTVTTTVETDANANVQFVSNDSTYADDTGDTIQFTFNQLNDNAISEFDGIATVSLASNVTGTYELYVDDTTSGIGSDTDALDVQVGDSSITASSAGSGSGVTLDDTPTSQTIDIVIDLKNNAEADLPSDITFVVVEDSA